MTDSMADSYGRTPLHEAVAHGREETVKYLLEIGGDLFATTDKTGEVSSRNDGDTWFFSISGQLVYMHMCFTSTHSYESSSHVLSDTTPYRCSL
jgi:ankyrin repeat protein